MTFSTDTIAEGKCLSECERGVASFESLAWRANETTPISFGDKANAGVGVAALVPRPTLKHPTDTASSPRPFPLPLPLPRPRPLPLPLLSLIGSDDPAVRSSGLVCMKDIDEEYTHSDLIQPHHIKPHTSSNHTPHPTTPLIQPHIKITPLIKPHPSSSHTSSSSHTTSNHTSIIKIHLFIHPSSNHRPSSNHTPHLTTDPLQTTPPHQTTPIHPATPLIKSHPSLNHMIYNTCIQ